MYESQKLHIHVNYWQVQELGRLRTRHAATNAVSDSEVSSAKATLQFQQATQLSAAAFCSQNCNCKHTFLDKLVLCQYVCKLLQTSRGFLSYKLQALLLCMCV